MRLVIDSLDPSADDLATRLGMLRTRLERILAREHVELVWRAEALPPLPHLGAENSLHVLRIVQEAVTNVLRHAKAKRLTLSARLQPGSRCAGRRGGGVRRRRRHRRRRCPRTRHHQHAAPRRAARSAVRGQCRERKVAVRASRCGFPKTATHDPATRRTSGRRTRVRGRGCLAGRRSTHDPARPRTRPSRTRVRGRFCGCVAGGGARRRRARVRRRVRTTAPGRR